MSPSLNKVNFFKLTSLSFCPGETVIHCQQYIKKTPLIWPTLNTTNGYILKCQPVIFYYIASYLSGQDEPNRERTRWSYLARSGLPAVSREKYFFETHIMNPLLTELVRSKWLDIGLVLFCEFMDLDSVSVHKHAKKKNLANIRPS